MIDYTDFPQAWPTQAERRWICSHSALMALAFRRPVIVHIGVELGISLYASHYGAPGARLVGVDLDTGNLVGTLDCELIQADSGRVAFDGPVHLLFVDGDHSQAGVWADQENWVHHVPPGGIVAFHDYHNLSSFDWCDGVKAAVDNWDWSEWDEVPGVDSIKAYTRRIPQETRKE